MLIKKSTFLPDITLQRFRICLKSRNTLFGNAARSARNFASERFVDADIPRFPEFFDLYAQIARCGSGLFLDVNKISLVHANEYRHDSQPQL